MSKKISCVLLSLSFACVLVFAQQQTWIANIGATQTGSGAAAITWSTAVPSDSRVYYRAPGRSYVLASSSQMTTAHNIALTGLTAGVKYQYYVSSTDSAPLPVTSATSNYITLTAATWSVSPTSISFPGYTVTNAKSSDVGIAVSNTNPFGLKITAIAVSGPFVITGNYCVATSTWDGTLAPNSHCNLNVAFKPTVVGQQGGMLTLTVLGTSKIVSLSGVAVAPLAITGPSFVDVTCDHTATAQFKASGGVPPYKFGAIPAGTLPAGVLVSMNASTGLASITWPCSVPVNGTPIDSRRQVLMAMGTKLIIHR